jgi:DNA-binding response OmpR family regulator
MAHKILIVEDDLPTVELMKFALQSEGFEVVVVYDGITALRSVEKEKPNLILLDVMIPGVDGFEVCQLLKHNIKFMNIPIIMVTAKVRKEDRMLGFEKGADDYVSKPFDPIELVSRIKKLITERELSDKKKGQGESQS